MSTTLTPDRRGELPHANLRAVLAQPGFRRLLGVRLSSQIGDGWLQAGLAGSVFFNPEKAAGAWAIAWAFAVLLIPYSTLGPFVGVFLDRWSRRNALMVTNSLRAVLVLPTAGLVWAGMSNAVLVATALAIIGLNRFFLAGIGAAQPHVVEPQRLVTANSFATTMGTVTYSAGLASAAAMFQLIGAGLHQYGAMCAGAALGYGVSAVVSRRSFHRAALGPDEALRTASRTSSVWHALRDTAVGMVGGLRHLSRRRAAASIMVVHAGQRGLYGVLAITTLLLYRNFYTTDDPGASFNGLFPVAMAAAVGALLAAVITPPMARRVGGSHWVVLLTGSLAVLVPALAVPFIAPLTVAGVFCVSAATQGTKIVSDTMLQLYVDDDYRGRVFSVSDTAVNIFFVGGLFLGALVLPDDAHSPGAILGVAAGYALLAGWYAAVNARGRPGALGTRDEPPPPDGLAPGVARSALGASPISYRVP